MTGTALLSPFVYWAQTEDQVTLRIDLKDAKDHDITIQQDSLTFSAFGRGARGQHEYAFRLNLYGKLKEKECETKIHDSHIAVILKKTKGGYWPRLISAPSKPGWLKIDFDKWTSGELGVDSEDETVGDVRDDFPGLYDSLQKEERGYRMEDYEKVYLVLYNLMQFVGFLHILIVLAIGYARDGVDSMEKTYENVGVALKFCMLFQWMEVMHPLFGYTKNSVFAPFMQVTGRSLILFAMIESEPRMQTKPVVFYLVIIWSSIEVIRYPYYISQLNNFSNGFLTWLRYTIWIPLYPLGILCEGIIVLRNIPYFEETKRFSLPLPNSYNLAFDMPTAMRLYLLLLFFPGMYTMMRLMYRERVKKLGPRSKHKLH